MLYNNTIGSLFLAFSILSYSMFDEEPLIDITDLSVYTVVSISLSLLSVLFDNTVKASYGSLATKDVVLWVYSFTTSLSILMYIVIIWFVFFLHLISPLVADTSDFSIKTFSLVGSIELFLVLYVFVLLLVRSLLSLIQFLKLNQKVIVVKILFVVSFFLVMLFFIEICVRFYNLSTIVNQVTSKGFGYSQAVSNNILGSSYASSDRSQTDFIWHLTRPESPVEYSVPYASFLATIVVWLHLVIFFVFVALLFLTVVYFPDFSNKQIYGIIAVLDLCWLVVTSLLLVVGLFVFIQEVQSYFFVIVRWLNLHRSTYNVEECPSCPKLTLWQVQISGEI